MKKSPRKKKSTRNPQDSSTSPTTSPTKKKSKPIAPSTPQSDPLTLSNPFLPISSPLQTILPQSIPNLSPSNPSPDSSNSTIPPPQTCISEPSNDNNSSSIPPQVNSSAQPPKPLPITPLEKIDPEAHVYYIDFVILDTNADFLDLIEDLEDLGNLNPLLTRLSATGKTLHAAFNNEETALIAAKFKNNLITTEGNTEPRSNFHSTNYVLTMKYKGIPNPSKEFLLSILQNSNAKEIFGKTSTNDIWSFPESPFIQVSLQEPKLFQEAHNYAILRIKRLGALLILHSKSYTNDPNYIKLFVGNCRTIADHNAISSSIQKLFKITPIAIGLERKDSNFPAGYGFVIVHKDEAPTLLNQKTLSVDLVNPITFRSIEKRKKPNNI
jgi:hypothetical protein